MSVPEESYSTPPSNHPSLGQLRKAIEYGDFEAKIEALNLNSPELIAGSWKREPDANFKRGAFMKMIVADKQEALSYLMSWINQVHTVKDDQLRCFVAELIYKVWRVYPAERSRFIRCLYSLLGSSRLAVRHTAAKVLLKMTSAPVVIKAALSCYVDIILKPNKYVQVVFIRMLIKLTEQPNLKRVLAQELVYDLLPLLNTQDYDVFVAAMALIRTLRGSIQDVNITLVYFCASNRVESFRSQFTEPFSWAPSDDESVTINEIKESNLSLASMDSLDCSGNGLNELVTGRLFQLTDASVPVYVESVVNITQNGMLVFALIFNQTSNVLQNCTLELYGDGNFEVFEQPTPITIAPLDCADLTASIKVSSMKDGVISGRIFYDVSGSDSCHNVVPLNDTRIDFEAVLKTASS